MIDINFKVYSDANGGDPDSTSPTLRSYHKLLWNKALPNGKILEMNDKIKGAYLYHNSELGEFNLGSDAITHSYRNQKRKQSIITQVIEDANELFELGSTIGAYLLFPKNKINRKLTINQARGINSYIDDRFDLTLECIRLFYIGKSSPLFDTFLRYENFFKLFETFENYINFFILDDLVDKNGNVKFYLPFDEFRSKATINTVEEYLTYKNKVVEFINSRNQRIKNIF